MALFTEYQEAPDIEKIAAEVIEKITIVGHVEIKEVLFLKDMAGFNTKWLAKCYNFNDHPTMFFTKKKWCIVVSNIKTECLSENQMKVLILHELMHIPPVGNKLVEHNVQDFKVMMDIDVDWCVPGREIIDIFEVVE